MKSINKLFVLIFAIVVISCTPEEIQGLDGRDGRDGINGVDGQDGADGESGASIGMITTPLASGCNELTFYYDTNNNQQNDNETVISTITVCNGQTSYTDVAEFPDYLAQGHTMKGIGVWRLFSTDWLTYNSNGVDYNIPVPIDSRFNIAIYPDPLNPDLLVANKGKRQTGIIDFNTDQGIGWSHNWGSTSPPYDNPQGLFSFWEDEITGISENLTNDLCENCAYPIRYISATDEEPEFISVNIPDEYVDFDIFPYGLENAIFYKISD